MYYKDCVFPIKWKTLMEIGTWYSMEPSQITATIPTEDYKKIRMSLLNSIRHRTQENFIINRPGKWEDEHESGKVYFKNYLGGSGDTINAVLNFSLPQGPAGIAGLAGSNSLLIAPFERWNLLSSTRSASGEVINIDIKLAAVWKHTIAAAGSFSINLRGDSSTSFSSLLAVGDSCTVVFANTSGSVPFYPSGFFIDSVQIYPKWSGGLSPNSGNSNSIDMYSYVICREGVSAYAVYANQTRFA